MIIATPSAKHNTSTSTKPPSHLTRRRQPPRRGFGGDVPFSDAPFPRSSEGSGWSAGDWPFWSLMRAGRNEEIIQVNSSKGDSERQVGADVPVLEAIRNIHVYRSDRTAPAHAHTRARFEYALFPGIGGRADVEEHRAAPIV